MSYRTPLMCVKCDEVSILQTELMLSDVDFPLRIKCAHCNKTYNLQRSMATPLKVQNINDLKYFFLVSREDTKDLTVLIGEIRSGYNAIDKLVQSASTIIERDAEKFRERCIEAFDEIGVLEDGINGTWLRSFYNQPFFCIPTYNEGTNKLDDFNRIVFCPKFIKPIIGFELTESLSHRIVLVNPITMFTFKLPEPLARYFDYKKPPSIQMHGRKITGIDLPLFMDEMTFTSADIDDTQDSPSLFVTDMKLAYKWMINHRIKPTQGFVYNFNSAEGIDFDEIIPQTDNQLTWYYAFRNHGRIVCTGGDREDFFNLTFEIINKTNTRVLFIAGIDDDEIEKTFAGQIKANGSLTILYTKKHFNTNPFDAAMFNRFDLIVIEADTWDGYGYMEMLQYHGGLLIYTANPCLDMLSDMNFARLIHGMAPYTSFGFDPTTKRIEDVSRLLTSSIKTLLKFAVE